MKKILFPLILVATVALGGVLAYSIWKAKPQTAQAYFESGKSYFEQKKYPEAIIQFLNAVRKDPRNRDARYYLALAYVNQQDLPHGVNELRALLEYYPEDVDANLQLGGIYLAAGRGNPELFRQAQEIATKILAKDPNNINALILSGNASAGLQDYTTSVDLFEKALGLDPQNLSAVVSLGTTQTLQKNYAEAERAFLRAREINPQEKSVLLSLGNYYRARQQMDKAEPIFKEALSLYPTDRRIYLQVVDFYYQAGRLQDVENVLRSVQAKNSADPEPFLILSDLYTARDRTEDARKLLLELKEKFPKNLDVSTKVALNFLLEQPERAKTEIDEILKAEPNNAVGHVLLGEYQFVSGKYDEAEKTLSTAPAVDSAFPQVHFFLGNIAMQKGQADQAMFHYQKSLAVNGKYVPARVALAEIFLNKGKIADSKEEIRKALEVKSDFVPARLVKATLDNANKDFSGAEQELTNLAKEQPDNALVYRQMALYYDSRGRAADAEKNFIKAVELKPDSPELLRDLILFYARGKQNDKAIQRINAIPENKKQAVHYELLGLVYSQSGKDQEAEVAYQKALEKDPNRSSSGLYLFATYMKTGRVDDGLKTLDGMIQKNPSNFSMIAAKGQIFESQGKIREAKDIYSQALKINPDFDLAANNLAYILAEEGSDLQTALRYAQTARQKSPENPSIADTLGWIYYKMGNHLLARSQLEFAVSKQPDNAVYQYHLGMIYKANKQMSDALAALSKAVNSPNAFKEKSLAQAALKEVTNLRN